MPRDDFAEPVRRLLAERAAYRCSNPDCRRITVGPSIACSDSSLRPGVAAHICAASSGGPRYDHAQTAADRASVSNGIWLCSFCGTLIDKNNGSDFPAATLRAWKDLHELAMFQELTNGPSQIGLTGWCEEVAGRWKLFVKNVTSQPFFDCVIYAYRLDRIHEPFADIEIVFGTIPPRQTLDDTTDHERLHSDQFGYPLIEMEYTDSEGLHWRRTKFGKLDSISRRRPFD